LLRRDRCGNAAQFYVVLEERDHPRAGLAEEILHDRGLARRIGVLVELARDLGHELAERTNVPGRVAGLDAEGR
jgi:hypothetical protein